MPSFRTLAAICVLSMTIMPMVLPSASADGMSMVYEPDYDQWWLLSEDMQYAVINFDGVTEHLLLQISISQIALSSAGQMLWLFPVPAPADSAEIGVYENFPALGGYFLSEYAKATLREDFVWIYSTQIYTIPFALTSIYTINENTDRQPVFLSPREGAYTGPEEGVDVFQHVEQSGLVTELIDTSDASALSDYLSNYGVNLPAESEPIVQDYADSGYSFVTSRIADVQNFTASARVSNGFTGKVFGMSVEISFPSQSVFYPMRLTSVYGNAEIPIVLQIIDYVTPASGMSSALPMEYHYCLDRYQYVDQDLRWFFEEQRQSGHLVNGALKDLEYTLVIIDAQADQMTFDLSFEDEASAGPARMNFIMDYGWLLLVPVFFGISMVSSLVAGSFVYRAYCPNKRKFAILGLANATTLVGMYFITRHQKIDRAYVASTKNEPPDKWRTFLGLFSLVFIGISVVSHALISFVFI